jgi:hypothetical protein
MQQRQHERRILCQGGVEVLERGLELVVVGGSASVLEPHASHLGRGRHGQPSPLVGLGHAPHLRSPQRPLRDVAFGSGGATVDGRTLAISPDC